LLQLIAGMPDRKLRPNQAPKIKYGRNLSEKYGIKLKEYIITKKGINIININLLFTIK
jgi:hypothetical protein